MKEKYIELTNDPLTNIYIMIPLLDDEARKAVSYLMYGCYLGMELKERKTSDIVSTIS